MKLLWNYHPAASIEALVTKDSTAALAVSLHALNLNLQLSQHATNHRHISVKLTLDYAQRNLPCSQHAKRAPCIHNLLCTTVFGGAAPPNWTCAGTGG